LHVVRTNVYVDGFNLYCGCVRGTRFRWLDLHKLCRMILSGHGYQLHRIRYFTSRVQATPSDPTKASRQAIYIRALQTVPNLSVHYGTFQTTRVFRPLVEPPVDGPRTVRLFDTKEKGSDVNLATYLIFDGLEGDYECAVVVSNDADLAEAIRLVRQKLGLPVGVLYPQGNQRRRPANQLLKVADFCWPVRVRALRDCLFPDQLQDAHGVIRKPAEW